MGLLGCPILGFADFEGELHLYRRPFSSELDDYEEFFELIPVERDLFNDAKKLAQWHTKEKLDGGAVTMLTEKLEALFEKNGSGLIRASAEFKVLPGQENLPLGVFRDCEVQWSAISK